MAQQRPALNQGLPERLCLDVLLALALVPALSSPLPPYFLPILQHGMSVEVKKKFAMRSERVKAVDLHPTEPWLLCALYSGQLVVYNYADEQVVRSG